MSSISYFPFSMSSCYTLYTQGYTQYKMADLTSTHSHHTHHTSHVVVKLSFRNCAFYSSIVFLAPFIITFINHCISPGKPGVGPGKTSRLSHVSSIPVPVSFPCETIRGGKFQPGAMLKKGKNVSTELSDWIQTWCLSAPGNFLSTLFTFNFLNVCLTVLNYRVSLKPDYWF